MLFKYLIFFIFLAEKIFLSSLKLSKFLRTLIVWIFIFLGLNGCLFFEGEIKNGEKTGKGKIYDECGHLIFEGNLENGIKQGKGKVYN